MSGRSWRLLDILENTSRFFAAKGLENARLQAELLLAAVLGVKRLDLYLQFDRPLHPSEVDRYREYVRQRLRRVPVQYITGVAAFRHLELAVTPAVLIPRPETEVLVEVALELLPEGGRVLDLCCGSGAVALSLAQEAASAEVVAADVSAAALEAAKANGQRCGLAGRVEWHCGDLFAPLCGTEPFDLVAANPPYVRRGDLAQLAPEVRDYEPHLALDGGEDGLAYHRRIAQEAADFMRPGGYLLLEVGDGQSAAVADLLTRSDRLTAVQIRPDLNQIPRVVVAQLAAQTS